MQRKDTIQTAYSLCVLEPPASAQTCSGSIFSKHRGNLPVAITLTLSATTTGALVLDNRLATTYCITPTVPGAPGVISRLDWAAEAYSCEASKVMLRAPCGCDTLQREHMVRHCPTRGLCSDRKDRAVCTNAAACTVNPLHNRWTVAAAGSAYYCDIHGHICHQLHDAPDCPKPGKFDGHNIGPIG